MSTAVVPSSLGRIQEVLIKGDLVALTESERLTYYKAVCESMGLNPLTRPFDYLSLNGKLVLYARKDCTDQLRLIHAISIRITSRDLIDGIYVVTAEATRPDGRGDTSTGAVAVDNLKGEAKANAFMKAETKAKRRVTLSICGLGLLDESEVESIPGAVVMEAESKEAAEAVAQRKLQEIEKAGPIPVPSQENGLLPSRESFRLSLQNASIPKLNRVLINTQNHLQAEKGPEYAKIATDHALTQLGVSQARDLDPEGRRALALFLYDAITETEQSSDDIEIAKLCEPIKDIKSTVAAFKEMKIAIEQALIDSNTPKDPSDEMDALYREVLGKYGVSSSNQFKGNLAAAKAALGDLYRMLQTIKRQIVTLEDVPS